MSNSSTVEAMSGLRVLLEEALRRSADPTPLGMHVAVVLLDGAVERALAYVLDSRGVQIHRSDGVEALHGKACQEFPAWARNGWAGTRKLHQARNAAQHQAIIPNHAQLQGWTADVRAYVRSLCLEAFAVDVAAVSLASAITDPEIRQPFERAEIALAAGDSDQAVDEALRAIGLAEQKWRGEREDALGRDTTDSISQSLSGNADPAASMRKLVNALPFVTDPGDHVWLESIRSARRRSTPIEPEDSHRAIGYVWGWIVRWQAFSAGYVLDRHQRWQQSFSVPTTEEGGPPRLLRQVEVSPTGSPLRPDLSSAPAVPGREERRGFKLSAQLVDLPADGQANLLREIESAIRRRLPAESIAVRVDRRGRITVDLNADEAEAAATAIVNGVADGGRAYAEAMTSHQRKEERQESLAEPYRTALSTFEIAPGVPALSRVEVRGRTRPVDPASEDDSEVVRLECSTHPDDGSGVMWSNALRQAFNQVADGGFYDVAFDPNDLSADSAAELVRRALGTFESWLREIEHARAEARAQAESITRTIELRIAETS